jgi:hypothetical protein
MVDGTRRRPLPAVICLLALTLLTALVWWRVLNRSDGHATAKPSCTTQSPALLPQSAAVSLSVLNATNRTGIAKATAGTLSKDGFKVSGYANDLPNIKVPGVAEIRFSPDQHDAATLLSYYFPGAKMVPLDATVAPKLVVSLGATFKAVATTAAARQAMTAAHVSQSPSASTPPHTTQTTPNC